MKVDKSYDIPRYFSVQLLTFVPFCSIVMYYWHFVILYRDEQNFSVCYRTISPLGNIGKYFAIVKKGDISNPCLVQGRGYFPFPSWGQGF